MRNDLLSDQHIVHAQKYNCSFHNHHHNHHYRFHHLELYIYKHIFRKIAIMSVRLCITIFLYIL